jgi:hypothetical protein
MISTKKYKKRNCLKCKNLLNEQNWNIYDKKKSYFICILCRKNNDKKNHQSDGYYSIKQRNRYRMRRSAVILAYGNACNICDEDDYTKLTINGDINFLYDNIVQKDGYKITCYNCYKNKPISKYKYKLIEMYGGNCKNCKENNAKKLFINKDKELLCYNCHYSQIAIFKYDINDLKLLG